MYEVFLILTLGIDDGYWKGEVNGQQGMFPCLVVEEIHSDDTDQQVSSRCLSGSDTVCLISTFL